jgi:hypothetical protein
MYQGAKPLSSWHGGLHLTNPEKAGREPWKDAPCRPRKLEVQNSPLSLQQEAVTLHLGDAACQAGGPLPVLPELGTGPRL